MVDEATEEAGSGGAAPESLSDVTAPWYDGVEDTDTKEWLTKNNPKDLESFAKNYRELEKSLGSERLSLPKEGENISDWEHWEKLGAKAEGKDYELTKPDLPEGMNWDESFEGEAREIASKLKVPEHIFQGFMDLYATKQIQGFNELAEHASNEKNELDKLYNELGPQKSKEQEEYARRAAIHLGINEAETAALVDIAGTTAGFNALSKIGSLLTEGGLISSESAGFMSAEGAKAEIESLNNQIAAAYSSGDTQKVKELEARQRPLFERVSSL